MTDYYQLPPPQQKKRSLAWLYLLLLLLFLPGLWATWWSLRIQPGEISEDPVLTTAALPARPALAPAPAPFLAETGPEPVIEPPALPPRDAAGAAEPGLVPVPPPLFSDVRWRETARFTGTDTTGRSAGFTAYVIAGDESWTYARADQIFAAGLDEPVETAFSRLDLGEGLCSLTRVIAVGAASVEGTSEQNTFLSHTRGHGLRAAISANLPCDPDAVRTGVLDLGYSRAEVQCPDGRPIFPGITAPQRPIAMILADAEDPQTNIGEALQSGIAAHEAAGAEVLPGVRISDYSAFDLR
jgi:hypothetical protein